MSNKPAARFAVSPTGRFLLLVSESGVPDLLRSGWDISARLDGLVCMSFPKHLTTRMVVLTALSLKDRFETAFSDRARKSLESEEA